MSAPLIPPPPPPADRWGERLIRRLALWSAVAVLVGSTIGSGIFRTPASVAQRIDDVPLFLLAWVVGAVVVLCGALTYSELAAAFPRSGGVYVFVRESFGRLPAFLFARLEEHTSELQSPCNLVCRLLLEKKKHKDACRV